MKYKSGIYCIRNKLNDKKYIGQSENIEQRLRIHKSELRGNYHPNSHLQRSFNRDGEENFEFKIVLRCPVNDLDDNEIFYIFINNSTNNKYGYNREKGGHFGKWNEESRQKLSNSLKKYYKSHNHPKLGKKLSPETRKKVSENHADVSGANNPNYNKNYSNEEIYKLYLLDYTPKEISEIIGCSFSTAHRRLKTILSKDEHDKYIQRNLQKEYSSRKGENNSNYNFNYDPNKIYDLAKKGYTIRKIASIYGADTQTISQRLKQKMSDIEYSNYILTNMKTKS